MPVNMLQASKLAVSASQKTKELTQAVNDKVMFAFSYRLIISFSSFLFTVFFWFLQLNVTALASRAFN